MVEEDSYQGGPKKNNKKKNKYIRRTRSPDYIVVEEEYSEEEASPRGRLRLRYEEPDVRRPLSPLVTRSYIRTSSSHDQRKPHIISDSRRSDSRPSILYSIPHRRPSSPPYRYVQARSQPQHPRLPRQEEIPGHYAEDDAYVPTGFSHRPRMAEYAASAPSMASREDSFESLDSSRSRASSSQRRRRERSYPYGGVPRSWEASHEINPKVVDETVVVTDRYAYRLKKEPVVRHEHEPHGRTRQRRQNVTDNHKTDINKWSRRELSSEDHAYYCNDWQQEEYLTDEEDISKSRGPRGSLHSYRRANYQDSELNSELPTSVSTEYRRACK